MAITFGDQIAAEEKSKINRQLEAVTQQNNLLKNITQSLMISRGEGGSPGQKYKPPVTNPGRGEAVFGTGKDGQRFFEFIKPMMIDPANNIRKTNRPLGNDDDYGRGDVPGHPDWKISHGKHFDEYGRIIQDPGFGIDRGGNPIRLPHMEQTPKEAEKNRQLHINKYHRASLPSSRHIRDRLKPFTKGSGYDKNSGSLRGIPDSLRIQLLRDAMAKNLPANNIRRLQDTGHMTIPQNPDGTGPLRIIDLLGPQNPPQA